MFAYRPMSLSCLVAADTCKPTETIESISSDSERLTSTPYISVSEQLQSQTFFACLGLERVATHQTSHGKVVIV